MTTMQERAENNVKNLVAWMKNRSVQGNGYARKVTVNEIEMKSGRIVFEIRYTDADGYNERLTLGAATKKGFVAAANDWAANK